MIKFLDLQKQYLTIQDEIDSAIQSVIATSGFIGGKALEKFEEEYADYCSTQFCIGVGNGTDALEIVIEAFNFPKVSEIIVPTNSFIGTAEAVVRTGHKVIFCKADPLNHTMDPQALESLVSSNTVAVIPVHHMGTHVKWMRYLQLQNPPD